MNHSFYARLRARSMAMAGDESGQALVMLTLMMVVMFGFCGLVIDFGRCYIAYSQLQASTNAAALAGANELPNADATTVANTYSGISGGNNSYSNLPNVTMATGFPQVRCLTTVSLTCPSPGGGNAVFVEQKVTVPLYFGSLFGQSYVTLKAAAAAEMRGAIAAPYNVVILLDTTASMNNADSACGGLSQIACAKGGVQTLLENMAPCGAQSSTCTISNNVAANSVDRVSLFTFPNITVGTTQNQYKCNTSNPTVIPYTFPSPPGSTGATYDPSGSATSSYTSGSSVPTYRVTPFWSDYKTSDSTTSLSTSSYLTQAVGGGSCSGMTSPGGEGTYYAGAIYAAQAALLEEQAAVTTAGGTPGQNVLIILSDGDATATQAEMASTATNKGTYPSWVSECTQAVTAAQYAKNQGTKVYTIAYGSTTTSGCATETSGSVYKNNTCKAMDDMATTGYFYTTTQTVNGVSTTSCPNAVPTTSLNQVFSLISKTFTLARLIPIGTS